MRYFYTIIFYLSIPFIILRLFYRSLKLPAYRQRIAERFGFIPKIKQPGNIWLHAVSLGESIAATPLIKELLIRYPDRQLIVTNMTPTGSNYIRKTFGDQLINTYVPYDLPTTINRFLQRVRPNLVIMMETELWPNIFAGCTKYKLPILIANARLSEYSSKGYAKIKPLVNKLLDQVTLVAAQTQADANRFIALGLNPAKAKVIGNIKFDLQLPDELVAQAQQLRQEWGTARPVWIAASTHDGEHEIVLQAFAKIRQTIPNCLLVLVPRHPERFKSVADLCRKQDYTIALRSHHSPLEIDTSIVIGDTLGELKLLYAASDIAFVGGSLIPIGGHNLLEPAAVGIPALTGPHMHNFVEINQLLQQAGVVKTVNNGLELANEICHLLNNPIERTALGKKAKQLVDQNRGALLRHLTIIENL
jgi:3-deoxy-D-manno-octulosonic-acid transferase